MYHPVHLPPPLSSKTLWSNHTFLDYAANSRFDVSDSSAFSIRMPRNDQTELTRPINGDLPSVTAEQVVLVSNTPISQISSPNPNLNYYHQNQPRYLDNVKFPNLSRLLQDTPWSTSPHVSQSSVAPKRENRKRSLECDASANDGEDGLELPLSSSLITTVLGGKVTVQMDASRFDYSPVFKKRNRTSPRHCQEPARLLSETLVSSSTAAAFDRDSSLSGAPPAVGTKINPSPSPGWSPCTESVPPNTKVVPKRSTKLVQVRQKKIDTKEITQKIRKSKRKSYSCDVCNRSFPYPRSLGTHKLVHQDARPYKCAFTGCTKEFRQTGHLQTHMLIHTGEKPFRCPVQGCTTPAFRHANRKCPVHPDVRLKKFTICERPLDLSIRLAVDNPRPLHNLEPAVTSRGIRCEETEDMAGAMALLHFASAAASSTHFVGGF